MKNNTKPGPRTPNALDIEVGSRIRQRRKIARMSQEALGDKIGVTFQQVQKYERGANRIGVSRLVAICDAIDTPIETLLAGLNSSQIKPTDTALKFHNTNQAIEMSRALSLLSTEVQSQLVELARALATATTEESLA